MWVFPQLTYSITFQQTFRNLRWRPTFFHPPLSRMTRVSYGRLRAAEDDDAERQRCDAGAVTSSVIANLSWACYGVYRWVGRREEDLRAEPRNALTHRTSPAVEGATLLHRTVEDAEFSGPSALATLTRLGPRHARPDLSGAESGGRTRMSIGPGVLSSVRMPFRHLGVQFRSETISATT